MANNGYLSADELLGALTTLQTADFTHKLLGDRKLRLQELTARQRNETLKAASDENGEIDTVQWHAMITQLGTVDEQGNPLFTEFQVQQLAEGRYLLLHAIANAILNLSGALPEHLFRGDQAADDGEPDAGDSAEDGGGEDPDDGG